ncbi:hypothetical protein ACP8Y2_13735 [Herpetosiphon llansteffanensis]
MQQIQKIRYGKKPLGLVLIGFMFAGRGALAGIMLFIYGLRLLDMESKYLITTVFMMSFFGVATFFHFKIAQGLFNLREQARKWAVIVEAIILVCYGIYMRFFAEQITLWTIIAALLTMLIMWYLSRDITRAWFAPSK